MRTQPAAAGVGEQRLVDCTCAVRFGWPARAWLLLFLGRLVWRIERALAGSRAERGHAAFTALLSQQAVFFNGNAVLGARLRWPLSEAVARGRPQGSTG